MSFSKKLLPIVLGTLVIFGPDSSLLSVEKKGYLFILAGIGTWSISNAIQNSSLVKTLSRITGNSMEDIGKIASFSCASYGSGLLIDEYCGNNKFTKNLATALKYIGSRTPQVAAASIIFHSKFVKTLSEKTPILSNYVKCSSCEAMGSQSCNNCDVRKTIIPIAGYSLVVRPLVDATSAKIKQFQY